jgi:hypothetical protein
MLSRQPTLSFAGKRNSISIRCARHRRAATVAGATGIPRRWLRVRWPPPGISSASLLPFAADGQTVDLIMGVTVFYRSDGQVY